MWGRKRQLQFFSVEIWVVPTFDGNSSKFGRPGAQERKGRTFEKVLRFAGGAAAEAGAWAAGGATKAGVAATACEPSRVAATAAEAGRAGASDGLDTALRVSQRGG